ncbi:MAG: ABC transporter permease, partial [Nocardiopsaceae bacterium]|nr:ABC transporter permease [Nocardiopsaceae bacterium]
MAFATAPAPTGAVPPAPGRAGLLNTMSSEWTKLRTLRSTYWTLAVMVVVGVGLAIGICSAVSATWKSSSVGLDGASTSLSMFGILGPLILMVLGSLVVTSEYSNGMIRTSLTAQPRRVQLFAGKLIVFTGVALITALVTSFLSFAIGQGILSSTGESQSLSDPNVMRAVLGAALYVTVLGMMAYAIGTILRHTAGTIATTAGLFFVLPMITNFLPSSVQDDVMKWLPTAAAGPLLETVQTAPSFFSPWT